MMAVAIDPVACERSATLSVQILQRVGHLGIGARALATVLRSGSGGRGLVVTIGQGVERGRRGRGVVDGDQQFGVITAYDP